MSTENPYLPDGSLRLSATVAPLVTPLPVIITPATPEALTPATLHYAPIDSGSGSVEVAPAAPGQRHKLLGWVLAFANLDGEEDHTLQIFSGTTALTGPMPINFTGGVPLVVPPTVSVPIVQTEVDEALNITMANASVKGVIVYITE